MICPCRPWSSIVKESTKCKFFFFFRPLRRLCTKPALMLYTHPYMSESLTHSLVKGLEERARKMEKEQTKYLRRLREKNPKKLDETFRRLHNEVFDYVECLECANCCTKVGPRFQKRDVERIAKHFNMHPKSFRLQYLELDEDEDWVLKKLPCPFLGEDNYCTIYEVRPKACAEYPYTDVKNMRGHLVTARKNLPFCPAVFEIVERLRKEYPL